MQNFLNFIQSVVSKIGTALSQGITIGGMQTTVGTAVAAVVVTGTVATGGTAIVVNEFNASVKEPAAIVETVDNTSDIIDDVIYNITETNDPTTNDTQHDTLIPSEIPSEEIPENIHVHDYTSNVIKEATCTEYGLIEYVCECGYSYTSETATENHTAGDWVIIEPATYNTEGLQTQSCTVCNAILAREVIAKVECTHNYKITASTDSTCTDGGSYTYTCEICGSTYDEETDADGHDYSKSRTVEATCTQKGATYKICEDCGDEVQVSTIDMKEHSYIQDPNKENIEATCKTEGHKYSVCSVCGHTNDEVITKDHTWNEGEIVEVAECEKTGKKVYTCTECNEETKEEVIPALGHDLLKMGTTGTACEEVAHYECQRENCEYTKNEAVDPNAHDISEEYLIIAEATCEEDGSKTKVCTVCESHIGEPVVIEKLGHDYSEWEIVHEDPCTQTGTKTRTCQREDCANPVNTEIIPIVGHDYEWEVITGATCTETGYKELKCTICYDVKDSMEIAKLPHNYTVFVEENSSEPTCTENGCDTYKCADCDELNSTVIPATGHTNGEWTETAATCTTDGSRVQKCTVCEAIIDSEVIPATGHTLGDWETKTPATCTTTGVKIQKCTVCNETVHSDVIYVLPHTYSVLVEEDSLEPTCIETGYEIYKCANCDATKRTDLDALGHTESDWETETPATCTSIGSAIKTCTVCGIQLNSKTLEMIPHSYELTDKATPTCIAADNNVYNCTVCGHETTESVAALGHTAGEEIVVEATDLREGSVKQYCTECGTTLKDEVIAKLPHTHEYTTEIERQNATCTTDGFVKYQCRCEDVKTETLTKTGHTAGDWTETKASTYTETGLRAKYCTSCGLKVTEEELDVLPHDCDYTEEISRTTATCTEKGMLTEACNICGERLETEILPTGHTAGEWETETPATCTADGLKVQKCTVCEATVNSESIPATGHTLGDWEETAEAGCETDGTETKTCSDCEYFESRSIPATGHNYGDWIVDVEPTEENEGSQHKECSNCGNTITEDIDQLPPHVHNYAETARTESTCSATGSITYSCECGNSYSEEIAKTNHSEGDWETISDATCTADGSKVKKCTSCGTILRTETIEKIAHVYSETTTVAATCTSDGYTRYKCNSCDNTYDVVIPAEGHDYGDAITETATCTHTGSIKYVCAICRLESIEETPSLGHNYVVTNTINPTCTTAGKTVYTCTRNGCNSSYEEEIATIEHVYNTTEVEATCSTDGYTIKTCENCGDEIIETQEDSATGHTAGNWVVTLEPTYTEKGSRTKSCVNCGEILETEEIPVLELPNGDAVYTITLKGGATTTVMGHYDEELAADLVDLVNEYRAENDLPTLTVSDYMSERAAKRGYETSHTWDHLRPSGGSAVTVYQYSAENLAWYITRTTAQEIFDALKDCEDHNAIMLSTYTYNETAVSVFCKYVGEINGKPDYEYYWVQIFD